MRCCRLHPIHPNHLFLLLCTFLPLPHHRLLSNLLNLLYLQHCPLKHLMHLLLNHLLKLMQHHHQNHHPPTLSLSHRFLPKLLLRPLQHLLNQLRHLFQQHQLHT
jgi:hypothetical protein